MENKDSNWITGFWRRIGAFFIDGLILVLLGFLLGLFLEDYFVRIGGWGRLVGFSIALVYFGVLNSSINKGQTIGKALLKINVVDSSNNFISVPKSFLRYIILGIPFFLNNARFTEDLLFSPFLYLLIFVNFGGGLSIIYLYIFNRVTRQSLHDVILGTYVTNTDSTNTSIGAIWKLHYGVVAVFFIAATITPYFMTQSAHKTPFLDMLNVRKLIMNEPVVIYANIHEGTSTVATSNSGTAETTYITVQAFLSDDDISNETVARNLKNIIVNNHATANSKDIIQVTLTYGYDLGMWSFWKNHNYKFTPEAIFVTLNEKGEFKEAKRVPLIVGQSYGWMLKVKRQSSIVWREVFTLPSTPKTWGDKEASSTNVNIIQKSEQPVKSDVFGEGYYGYISNIWSVAEGDPAGVYNFKIYYDDALVREFDIEFYEQ